MIPYSLSEKPMTRFDKTDVAITGLGCVAVLAWAIGLLLSLATTVGFAACVFLGAYYLCTGQFFFA